MKALATTASLMSRKKIIKMLGMNKPQMLVKCPYKNIIYSVEKKTDDIDIVFEPFVEKNHTLLERRGKPLPPWAKDPVINSPNRSNLLASKPIRYIYLCLSEKNKAELSEKNKAEAELSEKYKAVAELSKKNKAVAWMSEMVLVQELVVVLLSVV
uniref:Uncharacterized protein n=1 Tax=Amphimedon queenslandica TaxID=400682 RepID=A0A1X7V7C3_AMPQE